ncbi:MAG: polymer-forming cytoskeletal protein [Acidobacteriota bacterium]|jgi:hypothetical protein
MTDDSIQDSTRYVISGHHKGAVLPGVRSEMRRDVFLRPGAEVHGGLFARDLTVSGAPVTVAGSVYARGSVTLGAEDDDAVEGEAVTFEGVVAASHSLVAGDDRTSELRFLGDLFSDRIKLQDATVRGNVYAKNAILENCVVLGGVFCSGTLTLENCLVSTFRAARAELASEVLLLLPFALSVEPLELDFPVKILSFGSLEKLVKGRAKTWRDSVVFADGTDVIRVSDPAAPTAGEGDGPGDLHVLSLGSRILDLDGAKEKIEENRRILEMISLGDHLAPSAKEEFEGGELQKIETALRGLLSRAPKKEKIPKVPFSVFETRDAVRNALGNDEPA